MKLIIIGYENSIYIRKRPDQFHALLKPQGEAGCAEGVTIYGLFGNYGDTKQPVLKGVTCFGIQNMVIDYTVLFKIPFVNAGGNDRLIA